MNDVIQLTDDDAPITNESQVLLKRNSGQLITIFKTLKEKVVISGRGDSGLFATVSDDRGKSWSKPQFILNLFGTTDAIENRDGQLVLATQSRSGIVTLISNDGLNWSQPRKVTPTGRDDQVGSIIQAQDGYYFLSYDSSTTVTLDGAQVQMVHPCMTASMDLINWEHVIELSSPSGDSQAKSVFELMGSMEFGAVLIQRENEDLYCAYISYRERGIVIKKSSDGIIWEKAGFIAVPVFLHMGLNMVEHQGQLIVFYTYSGSPNTGNDLYASILSDEQWKGPIKIFHDTPLGANAVVLGTEIGIVFPRDYSDKRNIFFTILEGNELSFSI